MSSPVVNRPLLTIREAADRLRLSERTVRRLAAAELLPGALRIGGSVRVDPDALENWLSDSAVGSSSFADHASSAMGSNSSADTPAERDGTSGRTEAVEPAPLAGDEGAQ